MSRLDPQTMFLALFFLGVFGVLVYFVVRSQMFAACALLVAFLLSDGIRDNFGLSVTVSGLRVSALDALSVILFGVGIHRALTLGVRSFARGLALTLSMLLVFHITRGALDFGFRDAINTGRTWIYFTAPLVFAATAPRPWDRRVWQAITLTGIALALVSIPYFLIDGLHTATQYVNRNGELLTARPIVAAGALVVLQAAILLAALGWPSRGRSTALAGVMIAVVVLVQHRTVWAAGLAVAALGFVNWSRRRMRDAEALVFGATGLLFLVLPVLVYGFFRSSALVQSARETTSSHSTFTWRTTSWHELIASHHSISDLATGGPSGASWARQIGGLTSQASPHNAYIEAFLRFGLPGLAIFVGLWVVLWKGKARVAQHVALRPSAVVTLLASQAIFGVGYPLGEVQGLIFGVFISGFTLGREGDAFAGLVGPLHRQPFFPQDQVGGAALPGPTA